MASRKRTSSPSSPSWSVRDCRWPPTLIPTATDAAHCLEGWVVGFLRADDRQIAVDGGSDEGDGNTIIHVRVYLTRFGTVECAFDEDFRRLMINDVMFVGQDEAALVYVQSIVNARDTVSHNKR